MIASRKGPQCRGGKIVRADKDIGLTSRLPCDGEVLASSQQNAKGPHVVGGDALATTFSSVKSASSCTHKRGPYRGHALDKDYRQHGEKIKIEFTTDGGRPLTAGQYARMASEIGKSCRDLLPLYIDGDWRTLQIEEKRRAWECVQTLLDLDDILNNPVKFHVADRWMSQLHKKHRAVSKENGNKWEIMLDQPVPTMMIGEE